MTNPFFNRLHFPIGIIVRQIIAPVTPALYPEFWENETLQKGLMLLDFMKREPVCSTRRVVVLFV